MTITQSDWNQFTKLINKKLNAFSSAQDNQTKMLLARIDEIIVKQKLVNLVLKRLPYKYVTIEHIGELRDELMEKFSYLPTKKEFYQAMDKWMQAASTADIEKPLHKHDHERIREFLSSCQA